MPQAITSMSAGDVAALIQTIRFGARIFFAIVFPVIYLLDSLALYRMARS